MDNSMAMLAAAGGFAPVVKAPLVGSENAAAASIPMGGNPLQTPERFPASPTFNLTKTFPAAPTLQTAMGGLTIPTQARQS